MFQVGFPHGRAGNEPVRYCGRPVGRFSLRARALAMLLVVLGACGQEDDEWTAPTLTAELAERGRKIYAKNCSVCHGPEGRGDGPAAYLIEPRPRDFVSDGFRFVSTSAGPTDDDLFRTVTYGMPGSAMPPWGGLPATDRWAAIAEVRRLVREGLLADELASGTERAEAREYVDSMTTPGEPFAVPPEPPVTAETIERGRMLYLQACAPCHDADGRGRLRRDLKDDRGFPVFARDFTRGVFKSSAEGKQIALRILAGIPQTPMPSYAGMAETPDDLWSIVHFVRSLVPRGAQDRVRQRKRILRAARVKGPLVVDLAAAVWAEARIQYVALMPLRWDPNRPAGLLVRAIHDGNRVAVRITWVDATEDLLALRTQDFCDAVAIQLSANPSPPLFTMGSTEHPVAIWHWKALWQADLGGHKDIEHIYPRAVSDLHVGATKRVPGEPLPLAGRTASTTSPAFLTALAAGNPAAAQERRSPIEVLMARGFGTLTARPAAGQDVEGTGEWGRGVWDVVFVRDLHPGSDALTLKPGKTTSIGFAVWDGSAGDRNGQKAVTIWHELKLDR